MEKKETKLKLKPPTPVLTRALSLSSHSFSSQRKKLEDAEDDAEKRKEEEEEQEEEAPRRIDFIFSEEQERALRSIEAGKNVYVFGNAGTGKSRVLKEAVHRFSEEQERALRSIEAGKNVYVFGNAGTGKSRVLKEAVHRLLELKKTVAVTATTGIAGVAIGGSTLHAFAATFVPKNVGVATWGYAKPADKERIRDVDVLFIDEISMCSGEYFDRVSNHLALIRGRPREPFGGMQVVLMGDFLQLQPVCETKKHGAQEEGRFCPAVCLNRGFAFQSFTWDALQLESVELTKVYRQGKDEEFARLLNGIRVGDKKAGEEIVRYVMKNSNNKINNKEEQGLSELHLFATNNSADAHNRMKMDELRTEVETYEAEDKVKPYVNASHRNHNEQREILKEYLHRIEKDWQAPRTLEIKVGAEIIMVRNTEVDGKKLANGSRGKVVSFNDVNSDAEFKVHLKTRAEELEKVHEKSRNEQREFDLLTKQIEWLETMAKKGKKIPYVKFERWSYAIPMLPYPFTEELTGSGWCIRVQIPMKIAFALSIHKSQGMSLDSCFVDGSKIFAEGQLYVALSRCCSVSGLRVRNLDPTKITASKDALDFYNHLRDPERFAPHTHKWWKERPTDKTWWDKAAAQAMTKYLTRAEKTDPGRDISEYLSFELLKRTVDVRRTSDDKELWKCPSCKFTDSMTQQPLQCCYDVLKTRSRKHEEETKDEEELRKRRRSLEIKELELDELRLENEKRRASNDGLELELKAQRLLNEKLRESNKGMRLMLDNDKLKRDLSQISSRP
jgi:ATP-dependent DNA helicase PIF1